MASSDELELTMRFNGLSISLRPGSSSGFSSEGLARDDFHTKAHTVLDSILALGFLGRLHDELAVDADSTQGFELVNSTSSQANVANTSQNSEDTWTARIAKAEESGQAAGMLLRGRQGGAPATLASRLQPRVYVVLRDKDNNIPEGGHQAFRRFCDCMPLIGLQKSTDTRVLGHAVWNSFPSKREAQAYLRGAGFSEELHFGPTTATRSTSRT